MKKTPGQIAYEAYLDFVGGVSFYGHPLPEWPDQRDSLKAAWEAAAQAVIVSQDEIIHNLLTACSRAEILEALKGISREELAKFGIV